MSSLYVVPSDQLTVHNGAGARLDISLRNTVVDGASKPTRRENAGDATYVVNGSTSSDTQFMPYKRATAAAAAAAANDSVAVTIDYHDALAETRDLRALDSDFVGAASLSQRQSRSVFASVSGVLESLAEKIVGPPKEVGISSNYTDDDDNDNSSNVAEEREDTTSAADSDSDDLHSDFIAFTDPYDVHGGGGSMHAMQKIPLETDEELEYARQMHQRKTPTGNSMIEFAGEDHLFYACVSQYAYVPLHHPWAALYLKAQAYRKARMRISFDECVKRRLLMVGDEANVKLATENELRALLVQSVKEAAEAAETGSASSSSMTPSSSPPPPSLPFDKYMRMYSIAFWCMKTIEDDMARALETATRSLQRARHAFSERASEHAASPLPGAAAARIKDDALAVLDSALQSMRALQQRVASSSEIDSELACDK